MAAATLCDPATLPCGHTYCLSCIQRHWDQNEAKGQFSCPLCRQVFIPRPSLTKSTVLVEAMEKLVCPTIHVYLSGGVCKHRPSPRGGMFPQLPVISPRLCPQHQRPLDLYCHDDKECLCDQCCRDGHKGHRVVNLVVSHCFITLCPLFHFLLVSPPLSIPPFLLCFSLCLCPLSSQSSVQALQKEGVELFSELVKCEADGNPGWGVLCAHQATMGSRTEGHIHKLEQELAQLRRKDQELSRLASMQDHICFLKDRKATLKAEKQNQPEHPDRFIYWRPILCREPLAGSLFYWETEWTGQKITIGVAYRDLDRKEADDSSRLGYNEHSWSLNCSGTGFSMWHAGKETQLGTTKARRLGVYLDQHEGVLAFYRISNNQAPLIHSLQTDFTGPLYPGFRF
uniref:Uncharacterized protein n=1 Tax=Oncorhynchus tshawytscha TaxID=74940 RepID=A0A8C8G176_ONCTS